MSRSLAIVLVLVGALFGGLVYGAVDGGAADMAPLVLPLGPSIVAVVAPGAAQALQAPSWLVAHWPMILLALGAWTFVASLVARKWTKPVSPPASQYAVLAHLLLIDAPSMLPVKDMAGIFGLPITLPYLSLSQHPAEALPLPPPPPRAA